MKTSIWIKLKTLVERHEELSALLSDPAVIRDQNQFRNFSKEYSDLEPIVKAFSVFEKTQASLESLEHMKQDSDSSLRTLALEEWKETKSKLEQIEKELYTLLLPKDPNDHRNVFLEIRAGAGGDEAAIFAGDLFRMYSRFIERQGLRMELMSESQSEKGGYKTIVVRVLGKDVYGKLKFESGVHRVQRVPETEAQGRIHTSTCTVAVLPEVEEIDEVVLDPSQLRIDTFRASGAGGQHVNRTDSAVRITHLPSGIVVECQDDRSQHKNKAKAMAVLQAKILDVEQSKQRQAEAESRKSLVGTGDRSERIRTYNFPQGRLTDHRINLTLYKLPEIMEGDLLSVIEPLIQENNASQFAKLAGDAE